MCLCISVSVWCVGVCVCLCVGVLCICLFAFLRDALRVCMVVCVCVFGCTSVCARVYLCMRARAPRVVVVVVVVAAVAAAAVVFAEGFSIVLAATCSHIVGDVLVLQTAEFSPFSALHGPAAGFHVVVGASRCHRHDLPGTPTPRYED